MEDKNSMNIESRIADFLAGQCSEKERQELQTLLERDEEAARLMRRMSAVWAVASLPAFVGKEEENLSKTSGKLLQRNRKPCGFPAGGGGWWHGSRRPQPWHCCW